MPERIQLRKRKFPKSILVAIVILIPLWVLGILWAVEIDSFSSLVYVALISLIPIIGTLIFEIRKESIRTREQRKEQIQAEYQEQLIHMKHMGKQRTLEEIQKAFTTDNLEKLEKLRINRKSKKKYNCTISRNQILDTQEILQCPQCRNYYNEYNLLIWLEKKKDCPVCKAKFLK